MKRCALRFGRLDFVLEDDTLYFLEVNPNGQWAWLDLNDEVGLITAMVNAIQGKEISAIPKLQ
jgi:D-alanine-D-alanine ligase-like ATP-grasp enzyme